MSEHIKTAYEQSQLVQKFREHGGFQVHKSFRPTVANYIAKNDAELALLLDCIKAIDENYREAPPHVLAQFQLDCIDLLVNLGTVGKVTQVVGITADEFNAYRRRERHCLPPIGVIAKYVLHLGFEGLDAYFKHLGFENPGNARQSVAKGS